MKELKKNSEDYLIKYTDETIAELVYDKVHLIKAYNYYSGIRDNEQFAHLEDNYGLGNPTSIIFVPLIRKHIDALVGEFLTIPIEPKISCKDEETMSRILRHKQLKLAQEVNSILVRYLRNSLFSLLETGNMKSSQQQQSEDLVIKKYIEQVKESTEKNYISNFEMAAQDIVEFLLQDRDVDFKNKLKILLLDLFITGETYYRSVPNQSETGIELQVLDPLNTFVDRNLNSQYLKNSYRAVHRQWLSKYEIMSKYGSSLSKEDIDSLDNSYATFSNNNLIMANTLHSRIGCEYPVGILSGVEAYENYTYNTKPSSNIKLYPVYEVEWLDYEKDKDNYITNRYSSVRIGEDIYILTGKDKNIVRSMSKPNECHLTINGIFYSSRSGRPYSLVLATADLQDRYDILHYYRDTLIANSGTTGDWVDLAHIPAVFGADVSERLQKFILYKKQGLAIIDSSQEGTVVNQLFSNGYDDTVRVSAIQAIDLAIQEIENTTSSITGVFRERLGQIEARDAVANVSLGVQQSFVITKQYYQTMELLIREMLLDSLDVAKIVYKNGISGMLILGENRQRIFTALPEHFTLTDFDIHIADSQQSNKDKEFLKNITNSLVQGGSVDPELLLLTSTSKSLSEMKYSLQDNIAKRKEENNQLQQLTQQNQELQQQIKELSKQLQKAQSQVDQYHQEKIQMDKYKVDKNYEIEMKKLEVDEDYKDNSTDVQKRRIELEALQLLDFNQKNNEVKNK